MHAAGNYFKGYIFAYLFVSKLILWRQLPDTHNLASNSSLTFPVNKNTITQFITMMAIEYTVPTLTTYSLRFKTQYISSPKKLTLENTIIFLMSVKTQIKKKSYKKRNESNLMKNTCSAARHWRHNPDPIPWTSPAEFNLLRQNRKMLPIKFSLINNYSTSASWI